MRQPGAPGSGHLLARVQGRADEVFHYQVGDLHPHVIRSVMVRSPEVADYQVRQTRTGIEADIIAASGGASTEALRRQLAEALAHGGLGQPDVTVRIAGDLLAVRQRKACGASSRCPGWPDPSPGPGQSGMSSAIPARRPGMPPWQATGHAFR